MVPGYGLMLSGFLIIFLSAFCERGEELEPELVIERVAVVLNLFEHLVQEGHVVGLLQRLDERLQ